MSRPVAAFAPPNVCDRVHATRNTTEPTLQVSREGRLSTDMQLR